MTVIKDRADAQEPCVGILVEEIRQQRGPEQKIAFVTEIGERALPAIQDHAATGTPDRVTADRVMAEGVIVDRAMAARVARHPSVALMNSVA